MSSKIILVPTHLDGLLLSRETLVTEAFADFSRLPYAEAERDISPDTANISESLLSVPFQDSNLNLKRGLHLHWSLPDALTKGGAGGIVDDYPAVPNRWLITRKKNDAIERQWVVESDYLQAGLDNPYNSIAFPMDTRDASEQPFRYLGRQLEANGWTEDATAERLSKLTAIGYGEPAFAAFYPNCHSVFGCFDEEVTEQSQLTDLSYQLIGWYSDSAQDPLSELSDHETRIRQQITEENPETTPDKKIEELVKDRMEELIKEEFSWNITIDDTSDLPVGMACYADLTFLPGSDIENPKKDQAVTISIGNTGTEALSAYMASHLNSSNKEQLEEQLENLLLQIKLQSKDLDLGPRFMEARHEKGFKAEGGGSLWEIRPANENDTTTSVAPTLPSPLADDLDALNVQQQATDQAEEELGHLRHILFADWYKYMLCAYPPDDTRDHYSDVDLVRWYIENNDLSKLQQATYELEVERITLKSLKQALEQHITRFNQGTVAQSILFRPLNVSTADTSGLTLNNTSWVENQPFSDHCLDLNGTDAYLSITGQSGVQALSLWVNIATQNTDDATLLSTEELGALMGKDGITNFWDKVAIDGVAQPSYRPIQWRSLPKDRWCHLYIAFTDLLSNTDTLYLFGNGNAQFLKGKLAAVRLFNDVLSNDDIYHDGNMLGHQQYQLKEVAGPRYWQPTEPVILLEGQAVEPTTRHGSDGRLNEDSTLDCQVTTIGDHPPQQDDFESLLTVIEQGRPNTEEEKIGYDTWTHQPWHPFLLEWEVEVFPMQQGGNLDLGNRTFDASFINDNYTLDQDSPELTVQDNKNVVEAATIFSGRAILTPYAKTQLLETLLAQLRDLKQEDCYQVLSDITEEQRTDYNEQLTDWYASKPTLAAWYATSSEYDTAVAGYRTWYEQKTVYKDGVVTFSTLSDTEKLQDFNYVLIRTYEEASGAHFISQALSGFNNALLMHHQTLQFPVSDPLGFDHYRAFADRVREAIADNTNTAPLPLNDFLPIRSGIMRLHKLRSIDSFGQTKDIPIGSITKAETVALPSTTAIGDMATATDVWLPPRFVQPVRINFRWLSAHNGSQELNTHPQGTPICGWLLANHLDNSLAVYDQQGDALGIIDQQARWRSVPGTDITVDPLDIANPYLGKVVQRLALVADEEDPNDTKRAFLQDFITATDRALENIDPESFAHHQELALLMGRPIAVVRASVGLQLKGAPAIHHGWNVFRQDLVREGRETDEFENVKVPIRIGERGQLNDGVLGYWKEENGALDTTFQTTVASGVVTNGHILSYEQAPLAFNLSLADAPQALTLLIDPRGEAHATTGMLPAKGIHIPKEQYAEALKKINITFLSAPVLMGHDQTALPLPNEPGHQWAWLAKDRFSWVEVARNGVIRKDTVIRTFDNGTDVWQHLLDKGWIHEVDGNRADIVPTDQRTSATLDAPINAQADKIQALLDAGHIVPVSTRATFDHKQVIKEGWLKLSPLDN